MPEKYERGDPTPILRSIEKAARILNARGIPVDLTKEMPWSGAPDYWRILNALHDTLWRMVFAKDAGKVTISSQVATELKAITYHEHTPLESTCHYICKEGPPTTFQARRQIPVGAFREAGEYIVTHTTDEEVDPEFIGVLIKASDRMLNTTENYEIARQALLQLFKETLAKTDPKVYDKFKGCLGNV